MKSLPLEIREIRATEARLQQIYEAARLGLKGDSLALASGMLPVEYRRLCQLDPIAEMAAQKGKADAEMAHAGKLSEASMNGDAASTAAWNRSGVLAERSTSMYWQLVRPKRSASACSSVVRPVPQPPSTTGTRDGAASSDAVTRRSRPAWGAIMSRDSAARAAAVRPRGRDS